MFFLFSTTRRRRTDENGRLLAVTDGMPGIRMKQIVVERADECIELKLQLMKWNGRQNPADLLLTIGWQEVRKMKHGRFATIVYSHQADQIHAKERQLGQIFLIERRIVELRPNQSQAPQ